MQGDHCPVLSCIDSGGASCETGWGGEGRGGGGNNHADDMYKGTKFISKGDSHSERGASIYTLHEHLSTRALSMSMV